MIRQLDWDSKFFGKKIGKLDKIPSPGILKKLIIAARKESYRYLTCRLNLNIVSEVQVLEENGFYLTDVGVVWERKSEFFSSNLARAACIKDLPMMKKISKGLFRESRFYNDPFFSQRDAKKLYDAWLENSLNTDGVRVFTVPDKGFISCKRVSGHGGDIPLVGVKAREQGKGTGKSLVYCALDWFKKNGVGRVTVRTQTNNIKAMNFYKGLGFSVKYVDVTMGKILDNKGNR